MLAERYKLEISSVNIIIDCARLSGTSTGTSAPVPITLTYTETD